MKRNIKKNIAKILILSTVLTTLSGFSGILNTKVYAKDTSNIEKLQTNEKIAVYNPMEDTTSFIKNPYSGWVVYLEYVCGLHNARGEEYCIDAGNPEAYFKELDNQIAKGLKPSILYMRMGWQWFEPEEDKYAWDDPNSDLNKYIQGAKDRNLQIAFRILVSDEATDLSEEHASIKRTVPKWLLDKPGVETYVNSEGSRAPYYDNPVYLEHYEDLIRDFSEKFDNPNLVAFLDAQGLGKWGEMHELKTKNLTIEKTLEKHAQIWTKYFKKSLLGATFPGGWGDVDNINRYTIIPKYKYVARRDAYGSLWLGNFNEIYIDQFFRTKTPLFAEVAYWHLDKPGYIENFFPQDPGINPKTIRGYLEYAIKHAQEGRSNTLDARIPGDWHHWTEKGQDLINNFTINNGYRLVPTEFSYPKVVNRDDLIKISHSWKNTALGFLPTADGRLKDKYKISFALLDENDKIVYQHVDKKIDPSWVKEDGIVKNQTIINIPKEVNLAPKQYKLAVSIVDTENNENTPGINLAVSNMKVIKNKVDNNNPKTWYGGWYIIDTIEIVN